MSLNFLAKPLCSIILSGILILVAFMSLSLDLDLSYATPDFTQDDNTNSLLEGIEPFDNTTSSNGSSSEITSSGGDDITSSGDDLTASETSDSSSGAIGDGRLPSSDQDMNTEYMPLEKKSENGAPNNPSALKDEALLVRESVIGTDSSKLKVRSLSQEVVFPGAEAGIAKISTRQLECDSDETLLTGGYDIRRYSTTVTVGNSHPSDRIYYLEVINSGPDALVSIYAKCLKPVS